MWVVDDGRGLVEPHDRAAFEIVGRPAGIPARRECDPRAVDLVCELLRRLLAEQRDAGLVRERVEREGDLDRVAGAQPAAELPRGPGETEVPRPRGAGRRPRLAHADRGRTAGPIRDPV